MHQSDRTYNQIAGQKVQRIEAISDGVFAIALTLLVLDIRVPVLESIKTEGDLMHAFRGLTPRLLSYFASFMTLGIFWTGHALQYSYIEKSDRNLNWFNLFFLMFVSVLPFTTAFLSEYIEFKFAIFLYWLNIFSLGLVLYVHWIYATKHNFLSIQGDEEAVVTGAITRRIVIAQTLYAIGALLCFINNYLSILFIIIIQLNYALAIFGGKMNLKKSSLKT
ncbi:MAG: DUF1211 domain-containing protein [Bacteroidetes bacterium]|nr:MAG: DUF1211 domain-containing protein [Bacteroidota bacterium]